MYVVMLFVLLAWFNSVLSVEDFEATANNWSDDEDSYEEPQNNKNDATTLASTIPIKPIAPPSPPSQPVQVSAPKYEKQLDTVEFEEYYSYEDSNENKSEEIVRPWPPQPESDSEEYSNENITSSNEGKEKPTTEYFLEPEYQLDRDPLPQVPLKIPFIPKSGPKHHMGAILKPGKYNGLKPQEKPKQVQSLPYESWAESPLSMAPKNTKVKLATVKRS